MFMLVLQTLLMIALAYLIGCLVGCLAYRLLGPQNEPKYVATPSDDGSVRSKPVAKSPDEFADKNPVEEPSAKKTTPSKPKGAAKKGEKITRKAIAEASIDLKISKAQVKDAEKADEIGTRPKVLSKPLGNGKDNLKRIRGVGPKNEAALNKLGVFHFAQIASWKVKECQWMGSFMAFSGRIERENWVGQAKLLASGRDTDFSKRVDEGKVSSSKA